MKIEKEIKMKRRQRVVLVHGKYYLRSKELKIFQMK